MRLASFIIALLLWIAAAPRTFAQGIGSLPTGPNNTSGTVSLDSPTGTDSFDVTPGSSFALNIDVSTSQGAAPVHSFSFMLPTESYLTTTGFQTNLPGGWTSSVASGSFEAENNGGVDIASGETCLAGQLIFEVAPDAPIGTRLTLPSATNVSILTDDNIQTVSIINIISFAGPTVVAAPEPSAIFLAAMALCVFLYLKRTRKLALPSK